VTKEVCPKAMLIKEYRQKVPEKLPSSSGILKAKLTIPRGQG